MTSSEKLIRKEFKIKTEQELFDLMEQKPEEFFKDTFGTNKVSYLKKIKKLMFAINMDGENYSEYMKMARSGSIFEGSFTSSAVGEIKMQYQANRKKLVNQVRLFNTNVII